MQAAAFFQTQGEEVTVNFIHIGDVHLLHVPDRGKPWSRERSRETEETLRDAIRLCNEKKADLLLLSGDIFDRPPTEEELLPFAYMLSSLKDTETVMIAGNHDYVKEGSPMDTHDFGEKVHFLKSSEFSSVYIERLNTEVHGFSYTGPEDPRPMPLFEAPKDGRVHILLLHGLTEKQRPGRIQDLMRLGYDYVALGHIHKPYLSAEGKLAMAGSLEPTDKDDMGLRGVIVGEINRGMTELKLLPLARREYVRLTIALEGSESLAEIREKIRLEAENYGREALIRLRFTGERRAGLRLEEEVLQGPWNLVDAEDLTRPAVSEKELLIRHEGDLLGAFLRSFPEKRSETERLAVSYGTEALLRSRKEGSWN